MLHGSAMSVPELVQAYPARHGKLPKLTVPAGQRYPAIVKYSVSSGQRKNAADTMRGVVL